MIIIGGIKKRRIIAVAVILAIAVGAFCGIFIAAKRGERTLYEIDMSLDSAAMTIKASQAVTYYNDSGGAIGGLKFNLYANAFRRDAKIKPYVNFETAYPSGADYGGIEIKSAGDKDGGLKYSVCGEDMNILDVEFRRPLKKGAKIKLFIEYTVKIPKNNLRFGHYDGIINLTGFFPSVCVYENGGFVECVYLPTGDPFYGECSDFKVTLRTDSPYTVAHSGARVLETASGGGRVFGFKEKNIRDFALCLSEKFETASLKLGKTQITYYAVKGSYDIAGKAALALSALKYYSDLFGAYPYKSYAVAETYLVAGGMEYPNIVLINKELGESDKDGVIVHETAHQWWYGLVGNDNINHAWMDEGLTELSTELFLSANGRVLKAAEHYRINYDSSKRFDSIIDGLNPGNITMDKPLGEFASEYEYVAAVYSRGHLMFKDIMKTLGEDNFKKALRYYTRKNRYKIAGPGSMTEAFNKYYDGDIRGLLNDWLHFKKLY